MRWITIEPHTHTVHSDGRYTVPGLLAAAKAARLDAVVLTDHNTDSGLEGYVPRAGDPCLIPGIEWTTFYGHVVLIAPERHVEWRDLGPDDLDEHLRAAHEAGAVVQMAHPFCPGEPFCCGCRWEFRVEDWSGIDAIEVWSDADPGLCPHNEQAYELWRQKWREGFHPTAVSARDWHEDAPDVSTVFGVDRLYIDERLPMAEAVKDAYRAGRAYLTAGPELDLWVESGGWRATVGGSVPAGKARLSCVFSRGDRLPVWQTYDLEPRKVMLIAGDESLEFPFPGYDRPLETEVLLPPGPVFLELHGTARGRPCRLLIANPVRAE